jgi:hypothetical protein
MANTRIDVNNPGIRQILKDPAVRADLVRRAQAVAAAAGEGHAVDSQIGPRRARASVRTVTAKAAHKNAVDHNLLRAFDAARR